MHMSCPFCQPTKKPQLTIKKYNYWTVQLHPNQVYLGRCMIILNRHMEDLFDISKEESDELWQISKTLRDAIATVFQPDLFNYASLGNFVKHVHMHVIPRYGHPVEFQGQTFVDTQWGEMYSPYDKEYQTNDSILLAITEKLTQQCI